MRPELASRLTETTYEKFSAAISQEIKQFVDEREKTHVLINNEDQKTIVAINAYLARENTSGEILRQDLKIILRDRYGYFGRFRFRNTLPRKLEALRKRPEFLPAALRRGDAKIRHPSIQMLQLQQHVQTLELEKKATLREVKQLAEELKASKADELILLEEKTHLEKQLFLQKQDVVELQQQCHELRVLLLQSRISVPSHLKEPIQSPSCTNTEHPQKAWSYTQAQSMSPAVFRKDVLRTETPLSTPPLGVIPSAQTTFS